MIHITQAQKDAYEAAVIERDTLRSELTALRALLDDGSQEIDVAERRQEALRKMARSLINFSQSLGWHLTIERRFIEPLSQANFKFEISVWPNQRAAQHQEAS